MNERTVTTQQELDAALADKTVDWIDIRSPRGVWIEVRASDSATVRASGSATVRAYGSATVRAYDSATVHASGSATVRASGSATVRASDSATVRASDSATVHASDSATVSASDSATVHASDSATVHASAHTAVHLHSGRARVEGGVLIDHTAVESDPVMWCSYHGVDVTDGAATVYKAVRANLHSAHGFAYPIGETVECDDWSDDDECGHGLHFSPSPSQALTYDWGATRFLECRVQLADLRPLTGGTAKMKCPRAVVVREVDEWLRPVATEVA